MSRWPEEAGLTGIRRAAQSAARTLRLPFRSRSWRGDSGNWLGAGIGNSIDFQDHRPYLPGDDPRYIDWQAYARTGHYSMKLYREEVSPRVDLVLDVSASMNFAAPKRDRALELFYFSLESGLRAGSSVRCHVFSGARSVPWPVESALAGHPPPLPEEAAGPPDWARIAWRQGSLRVVVTDLLYPGSPEPLLASLSAAKGRGLLLAPFDREEAEPDWADNVEFVDCESGAERVQHVSPEVRTRYAAAYRRHFEMWKDLSRRHGIVVARVDAVPAFLDALQLEPLRLGAVEFLA
jgi:uncharacterized protein (DUF58 family)